MFIQQKRPESNQASSASSSSDRQNASYFVGSHIQSVQLIISLIAKYYASQKTFKVLYLGDSEERVCVTGSLLESHYVCNATNFVAIKYNNHWQEAAPAPCYTKELEAPRSVLCTTCSNAFRWFFEQRDLIDIELEDEEENSVSSPFEFDLIVFDDTRELIHNEKFSDFVQRYHQFSVANPSKKPLIYSIICATNSLDEEHFGTELGRVAKVLEISQFLDGQEHVNTTNATSNPKLKFEGVHLSEQEKKFLNELTTLKEFISEYLLSEYGILVAPQDIESSSLLKSFEWYAKNAHRLNISIAVQALRVVHKAIQILQVTTIANCLNWIRQKFKAFEVTPEFQSQQSRSKDAVEAFFHHWKSKQQKVQEIKHAKKSREYLFSELDKWQKKQVEFRVSENMTPSAVVHVAKMLESKKDVNLVVVPTIVSVPLLCNQFEMMKIRATSLRDLQAKAQSVEAVVCTTHDLEVMRKEHQEDLQSVFTSIIRLDTNKSEPSADIPMPTDSNVICIFCRDIVAEHLKHETNITTIILRLTKLSKHSLHQAMNNIASEETSATTKTDSQPSRTVTFKSERSISPATTTSSHKRKEYDGQTSKSENKKQKIQHNSSTSTSSSSSPVTFNSVPGDVDAVSLLSIITQKCFKEAVKYDSKELHFDPNTNTHTFKATASLIIKKEGKVLNFTSEGFGKSKKDSRKNAALKLFVDLSQAGQLPGAAINFTGTMDGGLGQLVQFHHAITGSPQIPQPAPTPAPQQYYEAPAYLPPHVQYGAVPLMPPQQQYFDPSMMSQSYASQPQPPVFAQFHPGAPSVYPNQQQPQNQQQQQQNSQFHYPPQFQYQ